MKKFTLKEAIELYGALMREIKIRISAVEICVRMLEENPREPGAFVHAEFGFLQIRMVCELVSLAAILAHHESPEIVSNAFLDEWNADTIFRRLSQINPECFPRAVIQNKPNNPGEVFNYNFNNGSQITAQQLSHIYGRCGDHLHRGKLKRGVKGLRKPYDVSLIKTWAEALAALLETHIVKLPHFRSVVIVRMHDPFGGVAVNYAVAKD